MTEIKDFITKVKLEAENELAQEREEEAKKLIKRKLKELENSKKIVKNLELELEDLYAELSGQ